MSNFFSVRPSRVFQTAKEESWVERVRQNARAFFELRSAPALTHGGGAFDLLDGRTEPGAGMRQATSLALHALAIAILLLLGGQIVKAPPGPTPPKEPGNILAPPLKSFLFGERPSGSGKGGNHDVLPPTSGDLPRPSPIVLVRPHIPDQHQVVFPVEPTILDVNSTAQHVRDLGLPWMKDRNLSNGTGGSDTVGDRDSNTVGTSDVLGPGGESNLAGPYSPGMTPVKCAYCPDPEYTDEARHEKLQGTVTLQVLVTAEGKVGRVKITRGLGLGLDERAAETVRKWRFQPARDAARNPIPQWVMVETTFRLF